MRFLKACRRKTVDATPVWFMRQAGRYMPEYRRLRKKYSIIGLCEHPEAAAEVTLQPVKAFEVDAAILFADILLPVRPMGMKLQYLEGKGPQLGPAVRSERDVKRLKDFDPREGLDYVLKAIKIVRRELDGKVPLIGFAGAPFTLASYMIEGGPSKDYRHTKLMMHGNPALWKKLMTKLSAMTADYLVSQAEAGAQALQLFDSWVGILSKGDFERFVLPYSRKVLKAASATGVPVIHFGTGTTPFLESFASAGSDVVGVDWRIPIGQAWDRIGSKYAVQGNLDPTHLFLPRRELKAQVREVLRSAIGRKGHIFNLGHGILQHTPVDNVRAVVDWVHEYSAR